MKAIHNAAGRGKRMVLSEDLLVRARVEAAFLGQLARLLEAVGELDRVHGLRN